MTPKRTKKRMGRPPKDPKERRSVNLTIRLTQAEIDLVRRKAKARGVTVTQLLLDPLLEEKEG